MQLARVIGSVVSVRKEPNLKGLALLVVEYIDEKMEKTNKTVVCTDTVSAGEGDIVLTCSSSSARLTNKTIDICTDNTIVGIVDSISKENKWMYKK